MPAYRFVCSTFESTKKSTDTKNWSYSLPAPEEIRKSLSKRETMHKTAETKKRKKVKSAAPKQISIDPFKLIAMREAKRAKNRDKRIEPGHSSTGVPLPSPQAMKELMEVKRHRREVYYENQKNHKTKRGGKFFINICMGVQNKKY